MARVYFKVTCWKKINIPDEKVVEAIRLLKKEDTEGVYDLIESPINGCYVNIDGSDEEAEELLMPSENDGGYTIEIIRGDEQIFNNAIK